MLETHLLEQHMNIVNRVTLQSFWFICYSQNTINAEYPDN